MDDYTVIKLLFFIYTLLNTHAIDIIRANETAVQSDDADDAPQYMVLPSTNSTRKNIPLFSNPEELAKIANKAVNEMKTSKTVHENVKVTIRKHSRPILSPNGRVNGTVVSYASWNNLDDSGLNVEGNKDFRYEANGVTSPEKDSNIKLGVLSSKSDNIVEAVGVGQNNEYIYNPYHTGYYYDTTFNENNKNPYRYSESSEYIQTNDIIFDENQNAYPYMGKITESGINVIKNDDVISVGSDVNNVHGSNVFVSQKIISDDTNKVISYDNTMLVQNNANDFDDDNSVINGRYNSGFYRDGTLAGSNMSKEHDSTIITQDKTGDDKTVSKSVSEENQIYLEKSLSDAANGNSSTWVSENKGSADAQKTLTDNVLRAINITTDNVTDSIMDTKPCVDEGEPDDGTGHTIETPDVTDALIIVRDRKARNRAILANYVCTQNQKNVNSFWALLDEYVYDRDLDKYTEKLNKLSTLLTVFTVLNDVRQTGGNIEVMIDNLIKILEHPELEVKIETEKHDYVFKTNKLTSASTKVVTIERDLQDDNIHVRKYKTKLDEMTFPKENGTDRYDVKEFIKNYILWPNIKSDETSVESIRDSTEVEADEDNEKNLKKVDSDQFKKGALRKNFIKVKSSHIKSNIHAIENQITLAPDTAVNQDEDNTPNFTYKLIETQLPSNAIHNNTETSESLELSENNSNFRFKSLNLIDPAVTTKYTHDAIVNINKLRNEPVRNPNEIEDNASKDYPNNMLVVPLIPNKTKPSHIFVDTETVSITPKDEIVYSYINEPQPVIWEKPDLTVFDDDLNGNPVIDTELDKIKGHAVEPFILENPVKEIFNTPKEVNNPIHLHPYKPDTTVYNIRQNIFPDYEMNYITNTPKFKQDDDELVKPIKYIEQDIMNVLPENEEVNKNQYLIHEPTFEGIEPNIFKKTSKAKYEEFPSYQYLDQPFQFKHKQDGLAPENSESESDSEINIFWERLKEQIPNLFMPHVDQDDKLNVNSDSFLTELQSSNQYIDDSYPYLFGPDATQMKNVSPQQNSDSLSSFWQLLHNDNEITKPEPHILRPDDNESHNDKSVVITPEPMYITAIKSLEVNKIREQPPAEMPYVNNWDNHMMLQNPSTDWSRYLQFYSNFNGNNFPNMYNQKKDESNPNVNPALLKLVEMQHGKNDINIYNNPLAYQMVSNDDVNVNNKGTLDNNNITPWNYGMRLPKGDHKMGDTINNKDKFNNNMNYPWNYGMGLGKSHYKIDDIVNNKDTFHNNMIYPWNYGMNLPKGGHKIDDNVNNKDILNNNNIYPWNYGMNLPKGDHKMDSKSDPEIYKRSSVQLINMFHQIKTHLNKKGMQDEVIDKIIKNVNDGLPEIEKEKCPIARYKQLVDKIRNAIKSETQKG